MLRRLDVDQFSGRGFLLQEVHCCISLMVFAVRMSVAILDFSQSSLNVMERITAFINVFILTASEFGFFCLSS